VPQKPASISVVIPARNAANTIERSLQALLGSSGITPEVLVVDDGSTDNTAELAARFPVTLIRLPEGSGPSAARNRGVAASSGSLLVFTDADVELAPDTLSRIRRYMTDHPEVDAVYGSYDAAPAGDGFISRYRNLLHHFVHQRGSEETGTFWCGCGAVRRQAFLDVGGLHEGFTRPSIEDIEFGGRLDAAGHHIRLAREIQVKHLKQWSLWRMMRTDIRDRAIPWTLLMLEGRCRRTDLNLQHRHRLSAVAVMAGLLSLAAGLALHPLFLLIIAGAGLLFHQVNRDLLRFFRRTGGLLFALGSLPLLILFYLYSSLAFGTGLLLHLLGKRLG